MWCFVCLEGVRMVIQHLGGLGFDLDGLGIGLHEILPRFSKEKGYPSSHTGWPTAWNKPCLQEERLPLSTVGDMARPMGWGKPWVKPCSGLGEAPGSHGLYPGRASSRGSPPGAILLSNFKLNVIHARYPKCTPRVSS